MLQHKFFFEIFIYDTDILKNMLWWNKGFLFIIWLLIIIYLLKKNSTWKSFVKKAQGNVFAWTDFFMISFLQRRMLNIGFNITLHFSYSLFAPLIFYLNFEIFELKMSFNLVTDLIDQGPVSREG